MDLLNRTKKICRDNNIKPARSRGQNFLIRESVYDDIVDVACLGEDDVVLETGPGLGFLTRKLAEKARKVIAVELDDKLAELLSKNLKNEGISNVEVVNMNVLDLDQEVGIGNQELGIGDKYKIVANLPYNITSVFLRKFLTAENKPESLVLMLQKEVAERIVAKPGKMSLLAVSVQFYADAEIVMKVPREDFYPAPEVESAVIKIESRDGDKEKINEKDFFRLVKFGFSSKRKMLKNNLAAGYHLPQEKIIELIKDVGFNEKIRAQELSVADWKKLLAEFENVDK